MGETSARSEHKGLAAESSDYVRFLVLAEARTGSTMLIQALNSSPNVRCFGEVFNPSVNFVPFGVQGYDRYSATDRELRDRDPVAFLRERIFCRYPEETRAVGFKLLYGQVWFFPGLLRRLAEDTEVRAVHVKRRNVLRHLISLNMVKATGVWFQERRRTLLLRAIRHPLLAIAALRRRLRRTPAARKAPRARMTVSKEELFRFSIRERKISTHFDGLFHAHPKLEVFYEDLLDHREEVFNEAQAFLGVEPVPLAVTTRRQNPQPLRELIENYDELYEVFKDTPHAYFLD